MPEIHLLKLNFEDNDFSIIQKIRKNVFTNELGISKSELFDETIIKLPSSNVVKSLKKLNLLLKSEYLGNVNLIDLRVENQIITE